MAEIRPFKALQYDTRRVPIEKVVTQPYDKISPEMRERYLAAHPNNLIRVLRPLDAGSPQSGVSPYQHAADVLAEWRRQGLVAQSPENVLFAYYQTFTAPGTETVRTRKGFIGLTRLADYSDGVVFPHERTLTGPREDRLELLRHTRTHFGQVFMLYSDPEAQTERLLDQAIAGRAPALVTDEYSVEHRLWPVSSPEVIRHLCGTMENRRLLIADGHHRYETALAFRNEERTRLGAGDCGPAEWLMTTLVNMESPDLVVLPTHRVLTNLQGFDTKELLDRAGRFYEVREAEDSEGLVAALGVEGGDRRCLGLVVAKRSMLLLLREGVDLRVELPDVPTSLLDLDVVLLHRLVLDRCLGLTEEDVRRESFIRYVREARTGIRDVEQGRAQACFLLNPTPVERVREIAFGGQVLPQKSTDFFPKLLSGLAMYALD